MTLAPLRRNFNDLAFVNWMIIVKLIFFDKVGKQLKHVIIFFDYTWLTLYFQQKLSYMFKG